MKYCKFCEEARDDQLEDCPICGLPLEDRKEGGAAQKAPSSIASALPSLATLRPTPRKSLPSPDVEETKAKPEMEEKQEKETTGAQGDEAKPDTNKKPEAKRGRKATEATGAASKFVLLKKPEKREDEETTETGEVAETGDEKHVAENDQVSHSGSKGFGKHQLTSDSDGGLVRDPAEDVREEIESEPEDLSEDQVGERELLEVIGAVNEHLRLGFDLFGLVGHTRSGKTHCLKALTYLLKRHGVDGEKARIKFHQTASPDPTKRKVFDYAYQGPAGERWVFVDAGGELYLRFHENQWEGLTDEMTALARWLQSCKGLFFFLRLSEHHFGRSAIDGELHFGDEAAEQLKRNAQQAQEELAFFRSFLLFLRALRHEQGGLRKLVQHCRESESMEKALVAYHQKAPPLDIPVMFFFSQADTYLHQGFEMLPDEQFSPRQLRTAVAPFVARYLPGLFADVASQVKYFKFDFLQSYEEINSGEVDVNGQPIPQPIWEADQQTPLSVGLLAGLEFLLRHQPNGKRFSFGPGISTLKALSLHRRLNPKQWENVALSLRHIEMSGGGGR